MMKSMISKSIFTISWKHLEPPHHFSIDEKTQDHQHRIRKKNRIQINIKAISKKNLEIPEIRVQTRNPENNTDRRTRKQKN